MKNELNKTRQYFRSIGTVYELALKLEDCDIKYKDKDGNEQKTTGERIMGNVSLRTQRGIHTFNVYFQNLDYSGEASKNWKMANSMLAWNPEINGNGEEPTRVTIEGKVSVNDYNKDGVVYTNLRWRVSKASTKVSEDEPTGTSLDGVFYVHKIAHEKVNNEETERLILSLMAADNKGACFPVDAIVEKELADAVEEGIEVETTVPVTLNRVMRHIGGKKKSAKRAIGGSGDVEVNTGFDIEELVLVGADEAIEEPEETEDEDGNPIEDKSGYVDPAAMKKAIKVRNAMLVELKENPPEKKGKPDSFKEKKAKASKAVGKGAGKLSLADDEDLENDDPF